jgi:hypothetical protein
MPYTQIYSYEKIHTKENHVDMNKDTHEDKTPTEVMRVITSLARSRARSCVMNLASPFIATPASYMLRERRSYTPSEEERGKKRRKKEEKKKKKR